MRFFMFALGLAWCALQAGNAQAANLTIMPLRVEIDAPASAGKITLSNDGDGPVNIQARVVRWFQVDGVDKYEATSDVVASPPFAQIQSANEYSLRVVRTSKAPVVAEERYRILIDQLPDVKSARAGVVSMAIRFSVPLTIVPVNAAPGKLAWRVARSGDQAAVTVSNSGGKTSRIFDLQILAGDRVVASRKGFVGYAPPGSAVRLPVGPVKGALPGTVTLKARTDGGDVNETVSLD